MHWIQLDTGHGLCTRGRTNPPDGNVYFIDPSGAHALLDGVLWKDGEPAPPGLHTITFDDGSTLPITVAAPTQSGGPPGRATRGPLTGPAAPTKGAPA